MVTRNRTLPTTSVCSLWLLFCMAPIGCTIGRLDYHSLPPQSAFDAIQPGVTTRSEVLRRLGPPEELRRLSNFDRSLDTTTQHRRILEAGDVFGTDAYTYASSRRRLARFSLPPFGPTLLGVEERQSREERWRIEFDGALVRSVSHVDEIGAQP